MTYFILLLLFFFIFFFFFNDTATTEIYTLSLHDALPISDGQFTFAGIPPGEYKLVALVDVEPGSWFDPAFLQQVDVRSEEHTSELQSQSNLVCRLLLEKKKKKKKKNYKIVYKYKRMSTIK